MFTQIFFSHFTFIGKSYFSKTLVRGLYITLSQSTDPCCPFSEYRQLQQQNTLDQVCTWDKFVAMLK